MKHGNYVERPKEETLAENYLKQLEKLEKHQKQQDEEDLDEDEAEFLKQYQQQRMQELKQKAAQMKFGTVFEIAREEYVSQVTEGSKEAFVVLHLYQNYVEPAVLLNEHLEEVARQYPGVKFVKMIATKCVENFPDAHVPTLIIYKDGKCVSTLPMVHKMLRKITFASLEYLLKANGTEPFISLGVIQKEIDEEEEEYKELKQQLQHKPKNFNAEVDDQNQDREYSHKVYMKY